MDTQQLIFRAELLQKEIELQGMLAENQNRVARNLTIAYNKSALDNLKEEVVYLIEAMRAYCKY